MKKQSLHIAFITDGQPRWRPPARSPRALFRRFRHQADDLIASISPAQRGERTVVYTAITGGFDRLLPPDDPDRHFYEAMRRTFGNDETVLLAVSKIGSAHV